MIKGVHTMFYSSDAAATRAFMRDKLGFRSCDVGEGWLIFEAPEGDLGVHPADESASAGTHDVSFYCDDIDATMAELKADGVEFTDDVTDAGFGRVTWFLMPGGVKVMLYQARYEKAFD